MANATEIKVPVRLEVLQESIAQVKATLSNLKPESTGWKELQNILRSMEKEANNLQVAFSKPFGSQAQFNAAERSIGKIDDALEKARITMSRIKFSDLKLNPDQQQVFDGLKAELKDVENEVKSFKANLKQELQMSEIWDSLKGLDPNATTHSFDQIVSAVQKATTKIEQEVKKAQAAMDSFQPKMANVKQTEEFFKNDNPLRQGLGDTFSNFFQDTKGGLRFKSGGKDAFYQWVEENLTLTDAQISQLKQTATSKLEQAFKDLDITKTINSIKTQGAEKQTNLDNAQARQAQATQVSEALSRSMESLAAKEDSVADRTENINSKLRDFKTNAENAARGNEQFGNSANQVSSQLQQLRTTLGEVNEQYLRAQQVSMTFNSMKMAVANFMGFNQVLNLTKRAIKDAMNHIKELDTVMNKISIVTDMSTADLWDQVDAYSEMASRYGVSIKGAYEVSQIYYQQGLKTNDVLTLTNETLKLSKISGLDYASTTDYMTTALRGFKMEMEDASRVVDVYSALAANTAVSSEELAVAMSKTASSMESVGSTFEETSAMIGTMVAVTRESATNIGSALKSIAARYGEMKKDPTTLIDADGETLAFNKVDAALQSVGISMKTTDGQFREFTDVILELSEQWDQLDSVQQRYIATQFAGNRQQSRFLALVSNADLLKQNIEVAENSEDTGTIQALKALDSIESKMEQVKVAYQQFYTTIGAETVWKGALDGIKNYIEYLNGLPKAFGKIPVGAIAMIMNVVGLLKMAAREAIVWIAKTWKDVLSTEAGDGNSFFGISILDRIRGQGEDARQGGKEVGKKYSEGFAEGAAETSFDNSKLIQKNVQEGAQKGAAAAQSGATTTADITANVNQLSASLDASGFAENIKASLGSINLDAESANIQAQFSSLIAGLLSKSAESRAAFSSAGTESMAAYLQGLLTEKGVAEEQARQIAEAVAAQLSTPLADGRTILDAATLDTSIADLGLKDQIQEQLNGFTIDTTTPAQQLQNMFIQIFNTVKDSGGQLKALFESASDDAIAGYIQGLINGTGGVSAAATQVGNVSVDALRSSIGAHSPAVETMLAGQDYMDGLVQGISQHLGEALAKGHEAGKSAVEGLERGLQLNENTFATLKAALLKEFDSLKDELFNSSAERAGIRATLDATTFEGFQGGMADPAFYKFAMMRQDTAEKWIDFGRGKAAAMQRYGSTPKGKAYLDTINSPADYEAQNGQYFGLSIGRQKIIDTMRHEIPSANAKQNIISDYMIDGIPFPEGRMGRRAALYQPYQDNAAKNRNAHLADNKLYDAAERQARVDQYHTADANFQAALQAAAAQRQAGIDSYKSAAQDFENAISGQAPTVEVHADTEPLKTETAEAKAEVEATPVEKPVEATTDSGASVDEQIAKWERLKEIQAEIKAGTGDTAALKGERKELVNDLGTSYNVSDKTIDARIAELKGEVTPIEAPVVATPQEGSGTEAAAEVKEAVESAPPAEVEVQVEAQQIKMDLDHPGQENFVYVTPQVDSGVLQSELQSAAAESAGQINMGDFIAPDLGASLDSIINMETGDVLDASGISTLLTHLQELGKISQETKDKLTELYSTKPAEDFVQAYGQATGTDAAVAGANQPMEMATFTPITTAAAETTAATEEATTAQETLQNQVENTNASLNTQATTSQQAGQTGAAAAREHAAAQGQLQQKTQAATGAIASSTKTASQWGRAIGMGLSTIAGMIDKTTEAGGAAAAAITIIGGAITAVMSTGPMAIITGITTALTGIIALVQNFSLEKQIERATKKAEELENKSKEVQAEYNIIDKGTKKLKELEQQRYESADAAQEYTEAANDLAEKFPALVVGFDDAGNAILDMTNSEELLTAARQEAAEAAYAAAQAELEKNKLEQKGKVKEAQAALGTSSDTAGDVEQDTTSSVEAARHDRISQVHDLAESLMQNSRYMGDTYIQGDLESMEINSREGFIADNYDTDEGYQDWLASMRFSVDQIKQHSLDDYGTANSEELKQIEALLDAPLEDWSGEEEFQGADYFETLQDKLTQLKAVDPLSEEAAILTKEVTLLLGQKDQYADVIEAHADEFEEIEAEFETYKDAVKDLKTLTGNEKGYSRILISRWQDIHQGADHMWTYLEDSTAAAALVTNAIYDEYNSWDGSFELSDTNIQIAVDRSKAQEKMETFWMNLNETDKALFDQMMSDTEHYSAEDFEAKFGNIIGFDQVYPLITNYYATGIKSIQDRLTNNLTMKTKQFKDPNFDMSQISEFQTNFNDAILKATTTQEETLLNTILQKYVDLINAGYVNDANAYQAEAFKIWDDLQTMPIEARNRVFDLIKKYGLTTKESVQNIITELRNNNDPDDDAVIDALDDLSYLLHENISLAAQTIVSNFTDSWKKESSNVSKLASGIDIGDVDSIINSEAGKASGLTMDDFVMSGDKLVLKASKLSTYMQKWIDAQKGEFDSYAQRITYVTDHYDQLFNQDNYTGPLNADAIQELESIMGANFVEKYMTDDQGVVQNYIVNYEAFMTDFNAAKDSARAAVANGEKYFEWAQEQLEKTRNWDEGNYESLNEVFGEDAVNASLLTLTKYDNKKQLSDYIDTPDVSAAVSKIQSAYGNLISDVLKEGFDNIDLSNYKGLIGFTQKDLDKYIQSGDLQGFIMQYAAYAGKTIDETNELIVQAINKQMEQTSADVLKDLDFVDRDTFTTDLKGLKELANKFDIPLQNLLKYYDSSIDQATVSVQALKADGIDLTQVTNFKDTVQESIDSMFSDLTSAIESALGGKLSLKNMDVLKQFGERYGVQIDFTRTKNGYRATTESVLELYEVLKHVDAITAQIVLDSLNESVQETNGSLGTTQSLLLRNKEIAGELTYQKGLKTYQDASREKRNVDFFNQQNGNVDLYNRTKLNWDDGSYSTLLTTTLESRNFESDIPWVMNVTPIPPDAQTVEDILSDEQLNEYIQGLLDQNPIDGTALLELDKVENGGKGLIINLKEATEITDDLVESMGDEAQTLHEISEVYEAIQDGEKYDDTKISQYERELELNREIMELRATSEDSSFKFMDNDIPAGQQNPLNYWENWGKAMSAIKTAGENANQIDYTDFYNIITEMGNLASETNPIKVSGEHILTNCQDAADLIEQAAGALTVASDGSIKVDLSKIGIDFSTGAGEMTDGVDAGIKALAESQIEMLDSMIQLMETIVAMEQLGDIDVEGNGIDFSDLFKATWNPDTQQWERDFTQFSEGYEQYRDYVLERIDKENYPEKFNEDLANGVNNTKLKVGDQEFIFGDMLKMNPSELAQHAEDGLGDAYAAVLQAYKLAAMSGNYDTDNIMSSIKEILAGTGFEGEIEIGDMHLVYKYDTVLEKGKDGKYHVGNKEFPGDEAGLRAAASYQHATELDALQGVASEQAEDGSVTFKHKIVSNVDYDVDSGVYNITFSDGSTATANSKEGANLAIATFAKMTDQELEGAGTQENEAEPITFTIHQKGKANLEFTVENGEVTVVPEGTGDASNASKAKASAQEIVDAEAAKAAQAAEGQKGTATINNLDIELTADAKITVDLEGKTIEATGTPTATVSTIKIMKDGSFTVTGDEEIWKELVNTKEGEEFTVSVLKLATKKQDGFTNDDGEPIWATIVNSKEGLTFTASVISLITSKDANFTNDDGATIWAELATTKEGQEFIAYVSSLKTSPAVSGFTNDKGQTIWDLVDTESDPMTFTAQVLQLLTTQGESFTNDEGASIWSLVSESKEYAAFGAAVLSLVTNQGEGFTNDEGATIWSQVVTDKSYPEFAAMVAKLVTKQGEGYKNDEGESIWSVVKTSKEFDAFTASVKKIAAEWASGASRELDESQLGIPSEYISPTPITVKKQVNVEYEENTDSDEQFKAQFSREMANVRNDPSQRGVGRTRNVTGITHDVVGQTRAGWTNVDNYGGVVIDEANLQRTERYVSLLQEDVSNGGILSETNRANLKELYNVLGDTSSNEQLNTLKETISEILAADATNLEGVSDTITALAEMPVDNVTALADALNLAYSSLVNLSNFDYEGLAARMALLVMPTTQTPSEGESSGDTEQGQTTVVTMVYEADTEPAKEAAEAAKKEIESDPATETIEGEDKATAVGQKAQSTINAMSASITITASNSASSVINSIKSALDNLVSGGPYKVTVEATVKKTGGDSDTEATGNVGLARAAGTLMGELGPELVVSGGRYFVAGQNGAEFVDLADDAIVFNHLQTEQLLKNGMSPGRGQALTNERNAVAFATGNMNGGPAMASASAALAALKQLRSMWQSLLNSSVKDLAGAGGSGGGGGGSDSSAFIKDLEKWYNWLQKIAQLEQEITMEETKRSKIASDMVAHGQDYFKSQLVSLEKLKEEAQTHADLAASQQDYFNKRRDFLNNQSPFSSLYEFDEQGQLKYKDGKLEEFSKMVGTDKYGEANMSAEDQYKYITQTLGIDAKYLKYDSSGNEIESDDYTSMVQAFWDKIDADKEEMQSLHDSINEHEQAALEAEQQRNEILKAIEDNQISVENKVLKAMEDSRQREIDELQDQRDAIEQASKDLIDGLSTQLEKEREMYQNQQDQNELFKLQRQLAILQRSGGSASEIASLQEQIAAKQQDAYFTAQQAQIDALQDASDAELERLDHQIDLMQETLDYEKENGLLWSKVYEVMQGSPESIAEYIHRNDSTYWAQSPIKNQQDYRTTLFEAQQYTEFRDTVKNGLASLITNTTPSTAGSSSDGSSGGDNGGSSGSSGSGSDSGSGSGGSGGSGGGGGKWEDTGNVSGWKKNNTYHWKEKEQKNSKTGKTKWVEDKTTKGKHDKNKSDYRPGTSYQYCSVCGRLMETINTNTGKRTSYDIGGIVEHDGEAVLHAKEAVLTAHQTSILRNEILGNSPKSLMNLLLDFRDSYSGLGSNISTSNSNEAFVIEHAEVNMNVEKIANDYDAQRAGEQALNKMLSIARKTQAQNRIGR